MVWRVTQQKLNAHVAHEDQLQQDHHRKHERIALLDSEGGHRHIHVRTYQTAEGNEEVKHDIRRPSMINDNRLTPNNVSRRIFFN